MKKTVKISNSKPKMKNYLLKLIEEEMKSH